MLFSRKNVVGVANKKKEKENHLHLSLFLFKPVKQGHTKPSYFDYFFPFFIKAVLPNLGSGASEVPLRLLNN